MTSLCDLTAHELVGRVRRGEVKATDVLQATLDRIRQIDGDPPTSGPYESCEEDAEKVHAFITVTPERAYAQAQAVDQALEQGGDPGPLAGVPLSVKDIFCVRGTPSTAGSRILERFVSPYTATPASRLEAAGAVLVGKVNLDEFTFGSSNESTAFKPAPRNPWDLARVPGGSSGGSAASVAAGECVISLGTDTAGSIRQPAAFCGVVGLKPTYGRVSRYGLIAFASSLDCPGPVTKDVADVAMVMNVIAGADVHDATAASVPVPDYTRGLEDGIQGMRIGLSPDYFRLKYPDPTSGDLLEQPISPEIEKAVHRAAEILAEAGAEIVERVPMPNTQYAIPTYFVVSRVEAASNLHRYDGVKYGLREAVEGADLRALYRSTRGKGFGLQPKLRILMGMYVSAEAYERNYYQQALRVRTLIRRDFEEAFDPQGSYRLDCLLAATTPTTAFEIDAVYGDSVLMQYADLLTVAANHAGIPGLSIPAGLDGRGLPIGIQFLGPDFTEERLLRIGRSFEMETESEAWRRTRPEILRTL